MEVSSETSETQKRRIMEQSYEVISPFEFKNKLIDLAEGHQEKSARMMLNAGRGNPNWIAATPREAFFALGHFAVEECRRTWDHGHLAGKPSRDGTYRRFQDYAREHASIPGITSLSRMIAYGIEDMGFDADAWVHELVDGIIGDNYPQPDRMLVRLEAVVHDFILKELCVNDPALSDFDLFAVEGATAAMCYIFESLLENQLLLRKDKIAIMVPIFPPYVEIPQLARYDFDVVEIRATAKDEEGYHTWQYPDSELDKLRDASIKALFLVNPSNPPSVAIQQESVERLKTIVAHDNPDLMIISDDVYSTFVDGFRSVMADLPEHTIGVYSFSKYFGVTGWRLGVIALNRKNIFDSKIASLSQDATERLNQRYASMTQHPQSIRFIDRMVADSRQVALNHTAGLSTVQQVQMALFCVFALQDKDNEYRQLTKDICHRRMALLYDSLELPLPNLPNDADYYTEFDLQVWANHHYGSDFTQFLITHYEPVDILFRLAANSGVVLLNGGGFYGPPWSIRVSLANLADEAYAEIGRLLHEALQDYVAEWRRHSHYRS